MHFNLLLVVYKRYPKWNLFIFLGHCFNYFFSHSDIFYSLKCRWSPLFSPLKCILNTLEILINIMCKILTIIVTISKLEKRNSERSRHCPPIVVVPWNKFQWPMKEAEAFWYLILPLNNKSPIILWRSHYAITQTNTSPLYYNYWLKHRLKTVGNLRKRTSRHLCSS